MSGRALELVTRAIASQIGVSEAEVSPQGQLVADLGLDSVDMAEVCLELEEELGVSISVEEVAALAEGTVADLAATLATVRGL